MEQTFKCLIIDDELPAQKLLEKFIDKLPYSTTSHTCSSAFEALNIMYAQAFDIILLDINMPEMSGIDLLSSLTVKRPQVIFTTAYSDFAIQGYEYDVTDYILKPFSFERFLRAINKSIEKIKGVHNHFTPLKATHNNHENYFWIKEGTTVFQINAEEILYIEGMKDFVKVHLPNRTLVSYLTMCRVEEMLPVNLFIRVSRSHIVRSSAIKAIRGNTLEIINKQEIPIGSTYHDTIKSFVRQSFIGRSEFE